MLSTWPVIAKTKGVTFGRHPSDQVMDRLPIDGPTTMRTFLSRKQGEEPRPLLALSTTERLCCERLEQEAKEERQRPSSSHLNFCFVPSGFLVVPFPQPSLVVSLRCRRQETTHRRRRRADFRLEFLGARQTEPHFLLYTISAMTH